MACRGQKGRERPTRRLAPTPRTHSLPSSSPGVSTRGAGAFFPVEDALVGFFYPEGHTDPSPPACVQKGEEE